jgi:dTDP-4-dehydrorhamnose reductase
MNSRLDTTKLRRRFQITPRPWREAIAQVIDELTAEAPLSSRA